MNAPEIEQRLGRWRVAAGPRAALECRDRLRSMMRGGTNSPRSADDAMLVVSELASNAVEHGTSRSFELVAEDFGTEVRLTVRNESEQPPPPAPWPMPQPGSLRGRGLAVVERVSRNVSADFDGAEVEIVATVEVGAESR